MKKTILWTLLVLFALNCSTYRMSEQKKNEIISGDHGFISFRMPNGKQLDGYDEKWRLVVRVDKNELVKDDFNDDEIYTFPVKAGEREVSVLLKRAVFRPFRMSYRYEYGNIYKGEIIKVEPGKKYQVSFETPERKVSVGLVVLGVLVPVVPLIGWPIGDWPASYSDMNMVLTVSSTGESATAAPPAKQKKVR
jgi:hypothetical protein